MINPQRIQKWIKVYLEHVREITPEVHVADEEGYKFKAVDVFQKNFDIDAPDLYEMLDRAIPQNNLVAGNWFFPRKMLLVFSKESPDQTRTALRLLFDESKPASERIDATEAIFDELIAARNQRLGEESNHFINLRFLSLLLGYRYPESHNALKPHEWKHYCGFVDDDFAVPRGTTHGAQYESFRPYIEAMRSTISAIPEITNLRTKLTEGLDFKDERFHWMAQDVIYVTSRVLEEEEPDEAVVSSEKPQPVPAEDSADEERELATIGERFRREEDLQNFVVENFAKLQFGAKLNIYTDDAGQRGVYYTTDYGEIDVLTIDDEGNFVVLELKRDRAADQAVNQLGRYMQWVDENLASKSGKTVRGIVFAHRGNKSLLGAVRALRFPVEVVYYSIGLSLTRES